MTAATPEPPPRRRRGPSFVTNVVVKAVLVFLAGLGLILLFRGCVAPALRNEVGDIQQKHHQAAPR